MLHGVRLPLLSVLLFFFLSHGIFCVSPCPTNNVHVSVVLDYSCRLSAGGRRKVEAEIVQITFVQLANHVTMEAYAVRQGR